MTMFDMLGHQSGNSIDFILTENDAYSKNLGTAVARLHQDSVELQSIVVKQLKMVSSRLIHQEIDSPVGVFHDHVGLAEVRPLNNVLWILLNYRSTIP